ncbi:hypothetical protein [Stutzerimonas balearica]|nr:hypothetical protein [Stutzerimonas balearica]
MFPRKPLYICLLLGALPSLALAQVAVDQTGTDNEIILEQGGGTGNSASQTQDGVLNRSRVVQTGNGNEATTNQFGVENQAQIIQTGDLNQASIYQANLDYVHSAAVEQVGSANVIELTQTGGNGSGAVLYQEGARNVQRIDQFYYVNSLDASSQGDDNLIEVTQNGGGSATLRQLGDANRIAVY